MSKLFKEMMKKDGTHLKDELTTLRKELFNLKVQNRLGKLEKASSIKRVKRNIARILTVLESKKREIAKDAS